ncbi:PspC domain-containing protein [Longispora albida]|uniref:PspC domain-containing protein n=1 Tax=Longispora albida TaxID=203523 RepID=UPI000365D205|nr:PspC domain-containing protein [Longispora albida]
MTSPSPQHHQAYADFKARYTRPRADRKVAGVCGAIGRATGTDPVLWRVLFAVFALVGGAGFVGYAAAWLVLPAEGDTGSPIEALFGKGKSSTSPLVTLFVGFGALGMSTFVLGTDFRFGILLGVLIAVIFALSNRRGTPAYVPPPPPPPPGPDPAQQAGTQVPFAPHGPFQVPAGPVPFAPRGPFEAPRTTVPYPAGPSPTMPLWPQPVPQPPMPVPPQKKQKKPREKSQLSKLIFFTLLFAMGALGLTAAAMQGMAPAAFFATALGVVGLGLVVGTWFGRAYRMILLGLVLCLGLAIAVAADPIRSGIAHCSGSQTWIPQSAGVVEKAYTSSCGVATLDLRQVNFADQNVVLAANSEWGELTVLLPPTVDVEVNPSVSSGEADVLGRKFSDGMGPVGPISDNGTDGPGGGKLTINLDVKYGRAKVTR